MKWIIKIVLVLCTVPLMAFQCTKKEGPDCHQRLDFTNNSDRAIYVVNIKSKGYSLDDYKLSEYSYEQLKKGNWSSGHFIPSGQTVRVIDLLDSGSCLESYLRNVDGCIFFVLDAQTVEEYTPEELVDGRAVLDKIYYTCDDIKAIGTTLVFE